MLQEVPDAVRIVQQEDGTNPSIDVNKQQVQQQPSRNTDQQKVSIGRKILPKSRSTGAVFDGNLTSAEAQQVRKMNSFELLIVAAEKKTIILSVIIQ